MLLTSSADRRVSVWAVDWLKEKCDLLDWLTFPAPIYNGVQSVFAKYHVVHLGFFPLITTVHMQ